ncbi:MAG: hypothetical protein PGN13_02955 [Patulibacter minatonensis]
MADGPKLEAPIRAVIDATNSGNGQAFMAAFQKDATLSDWGEVHTGRGEIGKWDRAENSGRGTKLKVTGVSRVMGEVLVLLQVTRDDVTEAGTWAFRLNGKNVESLDIG